MPIKQLVDFTEGRMGDNLIDGFPEVSGEISHLANSFQKMTNRVQELEDQLQSKDDASPPDLQS